MKIAVCVATATGGAATEADLLERRGRVGRAVLNPFDARAVEQALRMVEAQGEGEIVLIAIASAAELAIVREGLALGAHRAIILDDPAIEGSDLIGTATALATLVRSESPDIVLGCFWSGDIDGTLMFGAAAARLGLPVIAQAQTLETGSGEALARRQVEVGDVTLATPLPCFVELADSINKPRYPTMKAKLTAKSKPVRLCTLADLDASTMPVGAGLAGTRIAALVPPPAGRQPSILEGDAATAEAVLNFLKDREFVQ